jgi:predicted RecB family endonuclease
MTDLGIPDIVEVVENLGTEDDLALYDFAGRYRYLSELADLKVEVQRAIDRTVTILTKWNDEYYQEGRKLDDIRVLIIKEKEGDITPAVLNQMLRRLFEVSQG